MDGYEGMVESRKWVLGKCGIERSESAEDGGDEEKVVDHDREDDKPKPPLHPCFFGKSR